MKIQGLEYERGFNLGNYEQEKIKVQVLVEEGENPSDILADTINFVTSRGANQIKSKITNGVAVGSGQQMVASSSTVTHVSTGAATTKDAEPKVKEKAAKEPKAKVEAKVVEENKEEPKVEDKKEEAKVEPKVEEKKEEVKADTAPAAKKSRLNSAYNRTNELHKKVVGEILTKNFPGWDKPDRISKAKVASETLNGKDFLDGEGLVLQSFTDELKELMK